MSHILKALEKEAKSLEESIKKWEKLNRPYEVEGLIKYKTKVEKVLFELKAGTDLQFMCKNCGLILSACDFDFSIDTQNCEDCGNHIKIEVTCPKCKNTRTVYRDKNFDGD